jgi:hypothetical protein
MVSEVRVSGALMLTGLHESAKGRQVARGDDTSVGDGGVEFLVASSRALSVAGSVRRRHRAGGFACLHTQLPGPGPDGPHAVAEFETAGGRGAPGSRRAELRRKSITEVALRVPGGRERNAHAPAAEREQDGFEVAGPRGQLVDPRTGRGGQFARSMTPRPSSSRSRSATTLELGYICLSITRGGRRDLRPRRSCRQGKPGGVLAESCSEAAWLADGRCRIRAAGRSR